MLIRWASCICKILLTWYLRSVDGCGLGNVLKRCNFLLFDCKVVDVPYEGNTASLGITVEFFYQFYLRKETCLWVLSFQLAYNYLLCYKLPLKGRQEGALCWDLPLASGHASSFGKKFKRRAAHSESMPPLLGGVPATRDPCILCPPSPPRSRFLKAVHIVPVCVPLGLRKWPRDICLAAFQGHTDSHGIWASRRKFVEPSGFLTCLHSGVGRSTHAVCCPVCCCGEVLTPMYTKCTQPAGRQY